MKLRNKKTGELVYAWSFYDGNESVNLKYYTNDRQVNLEYNSLAELNDEWEDYEPVEPSHQRQKPPRKSRESRKTLKMWADANGFKKVSYRVDSWVSEFYNECNPAECATTIEFGWIMEGLKPGTYAITELCGNEEE